MLTLLSSPSSSLAAQIHELTDHFQLRSESLDEEPRRSVVCHRTPTTGIPTPTLAEALAASRKSASMTLNLGSLRRALPDKKPNNALYLEGVLGYDEEMLTEILVPHMRGLKFILTWVVRPLSSLTSSCLEHSCAATNSRTPLQTDEDVLITFDLPVLDLETKLSSVSSALKHVISDTGFCVSVDPVVLGDDGRVVRGSWTPVGGPSSSSFGAAGAGASSSSAASSAPMSARGSASGAWRNQGIKTGNAFASLGQGSSPPKPAQQAGHAWGQLIGVGHAKVRSLSLSPSLTRLTRPKLTRASHRSLLAPSSRRRASSSVTSPSLPPRSSPPPRHRRAASLRRACLLLRPLRGPTTTCRTSGTPASRTRRRTTKRSRRRASWPTKEGPHLCLARPAPHRTASSFFLTGRASSSAS